MRKYADTFTGAAAPGSSSGTGGLAPTGGIPSAPVNGSALKPSMPVAPTPKVPTRNSWVPNQIHNFASTFNNFVPPEADKAQEWYRQVKDPNTNWLNPGKIDAAKNIVNWMDKNKTHPVVQQYANNPQIKQQLDTFKGPMGQVAQWGAPVLNKLTSDPEQFARFASMPMIKELFKNIVGPAGIPGLAFAHSALSGNMKNWNTLMGKTSSVKGDTIDQYLLRLRCINKR